MTLVAQDPRSRTGLAGYLQRSGFEVRTLAAIPHGGRATRVLVWLTDLADGAGAIDAWLAADGARRAIAVTARPAAFAALRAAHPGQLAVLPAPVFGWQVVDALRGMLAPWRADHPLRRP